MVQCGDKTVSWDFFRRGLILLRQTHLPDATMRAGLLPNPLLFLQYCTYEVANAWDGMATVIHGSALAGCSDPRDRVYGFLGLCDKRLARRIRPDYNMPTGQIYTLFFTNFLEEYADLLLLQFCTLGTRNLDAPTWVPDLCNIVARPNTFAFSAGGTCAEAELLTPGVLRALGVRASIVKEVSRMSLNEATPPVDKTVSGPACFSISTRI